MPTIYHPSPIGVIRIREHEGFISSVNIRDVAGDEEEQSTPLLQMAARQLDEYFAGERKEFDFPIQQPGSAFQQEVWQCLLKIGYGKTISYLQQSKIMNNPLAIRAIASTNGKNDLAIVVPCHRVIGSDGSLTGYAGGLWRKKWLLEHEARVLGVGQTRLF
ncbi:methylated-DNA--[protein]-cysteine S-methyltransferase [Mucilaginibacter sp.]|jgi:methylated-DNA-[protein]-cysteine S-methyltransferase|uniref:methylated-DNA--[protein]-cysteine S-methyltransferase n=1 Tax=Mucilaginibacter sp. TaxID=1882438 RepID=UPI002BE2D97B|nr:methylated-DNA--[protein]-cysteine S-methyltransferase [Mucilaginibacter sp.]HTI57805.1 methylated-DNA--[protein]-cysteine S-methyltransferase [Mucilaginibacter sp.]